MNQVGNQVVIYVCLLCRGLISIQLVAHIAVSYCREGTETIESYTCFICSDVNFPLCLYFTPVRFLIRFMQISINSPLTTSVRSRKRLSPHSKKATWERKKRRKHRQMANWQDNTAGKIDSRGDGAHSVSRSALSRSSTRPNGRAARDWKVRYGGCSCEITDRCLFWPLGGNVASWVLGLLDSDLLRLRCSLLPRGLG